MTTSRGMAVALALLMVAGAPFVAQAVQAQQADRTDPHLAIRAANAGPDTWEAHITVDGPETWSREVTLAAGESFHQRVYGSPGTYEVEVDGQENTTTATVDTSDCPGPFLVAAFRHPEAGLEVERTTCQGDLSRFDALVDEALAAREAGGGDAIEVPTPRDASAGRLLLSGGLDRPDWSDATEIPFRWVPNGTFYDEWGRQTPGAEVALRLPISLEASVDYGVTTQVATLDTVQSRILYAQGEREPVARTSGHSLFVSGGPTGSSSEVGWTIGYEPEPTLTTCLFRNQVQGDDLAAGEQPTRAPCPDLFEGEASWWTGEAGLERGYRTVPTYGVDDPQDPSTVARLVWADGVPYPILAETFEVPDDDQVQHRATNLTHWTPNGSQQTIDGAVGLAPQLDVRPLNPLEGPVLNDHDRFAFELAEASRDARANPTLTDLQAILDEGGVLAGAALGSPGGTDGGNARELAWTMAFTTDDEGPVFVECRRAAAQQGAAAVSPPASSCEERDRPPIYAFELSWVPRVGPGELPSRSVTWDVALDRRALVDLENATEPVTVASYLPVAPGHDGSGDVGWLAVGTEGTEPEPGPAESDEVTTLVSVHLDDGSTHSFRTGAKEVDGLSDPGDVLASEGSTSEGSSGVFASPEELDGSTAAAAGAGILGLLAFAVFALYSRMQRDEVLEHDTRRRIRALVADEPGLHGKEIGRRVKANDRTVEHHLDVLVREDVLATLERGGYKHYFVEGKHPPREMQAYASLRRGQAEQVYEHVRQHPGLDLSTLAERAEISKPYASKLVARLVDAGLVDKVRDGRKATLYANEI